MIRFNQPRMIRLGTMLTLGLASAALLNIVPAQARNTPAATTGTPRLQMSPAFQTASNAALTAWIAAKARPDVVASQQQVVAAATALEASTTRSAQRTAQTAYEAAQTALVALVQPEVTQFQGLIPLIVNLDDKYQAGSIGLDMGLFLQSQPIQRQAITLELESGKVAPERQPVFHYYVGKFAYAARDYADARAHLLAATQGGYHDGEADRYLAETYFSQNDAPGGIAVLKAAYDLAVQQARTPSVQALQRGLSVASDALLAPDAGWFGAALIKAEPNTDNWQRAIAAVRRTAHYERDGLLDLARLMHRTNSYQGASDYFEYIQLGNNLGLPREVLASINVGVAAHTLVDSDIAVRDARTAAAAREARDTAQGLLAGYDRDARASGATTAVITGAADSFLSYGQPAKAEEFLRIAATRPGADLGEIQTRLGIALFDQSKFADAAASFGQVTGPRAPLAALWAVLATQRAAAPAT
jgi:tetratricopeptide (TPR) repeat protein